MSNTNFSTDIISSTLHHYGKKLWSNILDKDVLLRVFKEKAMDVVPGGRKLAYPQIYLSNQTFESYAGADEIDLSIQQALTHAEYSWAQYAGSVVITGIDLFKNSGSKEQILNLLDAKVQQLEETAVATLSNHIANAASGQNMLGLKDLFYCTTASTVGGIAGGTYSYWRNANAIFTTTYNASGNFGTSVAGDGMSVMNKMMKDAAPDGESPDLILTTPIIHGFIENVLVSNQRFLGDEADWGFSSIPFKGAKIFFDGNIATSNIFFINSNATRLVIGKGANFRPQKVADPANQDVKVWLYTIYLQLVTKNRRKNARVGNIGVQG
jgi:hypothetical protein